MGATPAAGDGLDIVLIARHPFGGYPPLGDWQMARALGRRHHVLYVEPPDVVRRPSVAALRRLLRPSPRRVAAGLDVLRPLVVPGAARPGTAGVGDRLIQRQVAAVARELFDGVPVLVSFDPLRGELPAVHRSLTVYWCRDRFSARDGVTPPSWLVQREDAILRSADLVSCVSPALLDEVRQRTAAEVLFIPNAADAGHFGAPQPRPADLPHGEVVVGCLGGGASRLDAGLLEDVAEQRPDWWIVLVGEAPRMRADNILHVPYVPYEQAPAWMQHFDVGLVPYDARSAFNAGSFPLKALEYLAAGTPVVSTPLPAFDGWDPYIRQAGDAAQFVHTVEVALEQGPSEEACRAIAAANTWDDRAGQLHDEIIRTLGA